MEMKKTRLSLVTVVLFSAVSSALAAIDDNAAIVELRETCSNTIGGVTTAIDNCFETMGELTNWISTTRLPDENAPLTVNIGPGTFEHFNLSSSIPSCNISLKGSGRLQTKLVNNFFSSVIEFPEHCVLSVSNLTIESQHLFFAIHVFPSNAGTGETTWSDVDVFGIGYGWEGGGACDSKHFWFNSRIITRTAAGAGNDFARAYTTCAEDWFYASELTAIAESTDPEPDDLFAIQGHHAAEIHLYGSIVRAITGNGITAPPATIQGKGSLSPPVVSGVFAITVAGDANLHMHGTAVDVLSSEGNNVAAIGSANNGFIHANEASYNLQTGSGGTVTRIINNGGTVKAPAVWEASAALPNIISTTGQDTAVYTGTPGGRPHIVIYDETCTGKWFDTTANTCL